MAEERVPRLLPSDVERHLREQGRVLDSIAAGQRSVVATVDRLQETCGELDRSMVVLQTRFEEHDAWERQMDARTAKEFDALEKRTRSLEGFRSKAIGALSLMSVAVGGAWTKLRDVFLGS